MDISVFEVETIDIDEMCQLSLNSSLATKLEFNCFGDCPQVVTMYRDYLDFSEVKHNLNREMLLMCFSFC